MTIGARSIPLIGLAPLFISEGRRPPLLGARPAYVDALVAAGACPVVLATPPNLVDEALRNLDAVVIPGGKDIPPRFYGNEAEASNLDPMSEALCELYLAVARSALTLGVPCLGICLGSQIINVAHGGTLIQDLEAERVQLLPHRGKGQRDVSHSVSIEPTSKLFECLGVGTAEVTSHHHQAVRDVGTGLKVVARAPDGVVEAVEHTEADFHVGVTWHPERTDDAHAGKGVFEVFVAAARRRRETRLG